MPFISDSVTGESDDTILQSGIPDSVIFSALCMFDFTSPEAEILSFRKNEILDIVKCTDGGWWAAVRKEGGILGWIPQTFVTPLSQEMAEKLWDIHEELRGDEFKRVKELYQSGQDTTSFPVFAEGSVPPCPKPEKDLANVCPISNFHLLTSLTPFSYLPPNGLHSYTMITLENFVISARHKTYLIHINLFPTIDYHRRHPIVAI